MIESIFLIILCRGNSKRAKERGNSGGGAIAYTLALWIGMEFLALFTAASFLGLVTLTYVIALIFAFIGGVISYQISKHGSSVYNATYKSTPYELTSPCKVRVFCEASQQRHGSNFYFTLNGQTSKAMDNNSILTTYTKIYNNLITVRNDEENQIRDSYHFSAPSGGSIDIHFLGEMFQPGLTEITYANKPAYSTANSSQNKNDW